MEDQKTLFAKIAEVMGSVSSVPKSGRNSFHKYDYATEADIVREIRDLLAERRVAVLPSVLDHRTDGDVSTVLLAVTLACGDTGQKFEQLFAGQGQDKGDKGYYKAYTGAMKYWALKTFLMPTGDDPEQDSPRVSRAQTRPVSVNSRDTDSGKKGKMLERIAEIFKSAGVSDEQRNEFLKKLAAGSGEEKFSDLTEEQIVGFGKRFAAYTESELAKRVISVLESK